METCGRANAVFERRCSNPYIPICNWYQSSRPAISGDNEQSSRVEYLDCFYDNGLESKNLRT